MVNEIVGTIGEYVLWLIQMYQMVLVIEKTENNEILTFQRIRMTAGAFLLAFFHMILFHHGKGFSAFFLLSILSLMVYGSFVAALCTGQKIVISCFLVIFRALMIPLGDVLTICVFRDTSQPLSGMAFLLSLLLTDFLMIPIVCFMLRFKIKIKKTEKYMTYAGIAITIVLSFNMICLVQTMPGAVSNFIYNLGMLLLNLLCYYLFCQMIAGFHREIAYKVQAEQNKYEKKYVKDVYRVYEKQRELRHDFHNHILCIKTLLKEKQYEELANYLEELGDRVQSFQRNIVTGNIAADALLEQKNSQAEEKGIPVKLEVSLPEHLPMKKMDFCAVVSNLFDNAMEASNIKDPQIQIEIKPVRGYLSILFKNRVSEQTKNDKDLLRTKKNPESHGLGLQIVKGIVEKYKGQMSIKLEDRWFAVRILIVTENSFLSD